MSFLSEIAAVFTILSITFHSMVLDCLDINAAGAAGTYIYADVGEKSAGNTDCPPSHCFCAIRNKRSLCRL
jgi:hypothetical protein